MPSEKMSKNSISFWMYLCRQSHTWVPNSTQNPWYPTSCEGHENHLWTLTHLGSFPTAMWSTLCIYLHSSRQGNIVPWWHLRNNSKWVRLKTVRIPSCPFVHSRFPTSPWHGGITLRSKKVIFSRLEKSRTEKYPYNIFIHISMVSASIWPSNMGMSKLTCTLKWVAPP